MRLIMTFCLLLPACQLSKPDLGGQDFMAEVSSEIEASPSPPPVWQNDVEAASAHARGIASRARVQELEKDLHAILATTKPVVEREFSEMREVLGAIPLPEILSTMEAELRPWGKEARERYREQIEALHSDLKGRLLNIKDAAMDAVATQAKQFSVQRSPLDQGLTGDPALEPLLEAFNDTLLSAVRLDSLDDQRAEDLGRHRELVQVFSTFGNEEGEKAMRGRLLLFVEGDESSVSPRCMVAFRADDPRLLSQVKIAQVMRYRVMHGHNVMKDFGWIPLPSKTVPGVPELMPYETYLVATAVEPMLRSEDPNFDSLHSRRVLVDIQSGVFLADGAFLGSVDWRMEYFISSRGRVTWQLSPHAPTWDPYGSELQRVLFDRKTARAGRAREETRDSGSTVSVRVSGGGLGLGP
ncbi:MAG: hypothetical protein VX916_06655 [Planctomycetota bacterium]|nr:hypothetical protein [Planctomycetota bacterium]